MQKTTDFNDVAIATMKENGYEIYFCDMRGNETMNKMENTNLNKKNWISTLM